MIRDVIFIDTCIFYNEGFFVPLNRISSLARLVENGLVNIVSTVITDREILRNFENEVTSKINSVQKNHKVLNCFDEMHNVFSRDLKKKILDDAKKIFENYKKQCSVYTIGYDYCNDIEDVFEKYFNKEKPFGEGKKEKEFPDAFALQMLENYCKRNGLNKIIVLSTDSDITEFKSDHLIPVDYKAYLTEKQAESKTLDNIKIAIGRCKDDIQREVLEQFENAISNEWYYNDIFNSEDPPEIEIKDIQLDIEDDFSIISSDDDEYTIELNAYFYCEVKCTYLSLDYAIYDREDGQWYGGEWESDIVKGEQNFTIKAIFIDDDSFELDISDFDVEDEIPNFKKSWES